MNKITYYLILFILGLSTILVSCSDDDDDKKEDGGEEQPTLKEGFNKTAYTGSAATDLIITEYCEGSSNNKYLEIFNGTGKDVDLSGYSIRIASNGKAFSENTPVALTGTLHKGVVMVIANESFSTDLTLPTGKTITKEFTKATYFNGDDAVGLFKGDNLIDVFGIPGVDPGAGWEFNGTEEATVNHVFIRKKTVKSPNSTWTTSEWEMKDNEDVSNLGDHIFEPA